MFILGSTNHVLDTCQLVSSLSVYGSKQRSQKSKITAAIEEYSDLFGQKAKPIILPSFLGLPKMLNVI